MNSPLTVSARSLHASVPLSACETAICVTVHAAVAAPGSESGATLPRDPLDVVVVLDRSSSMGGAKLSLCKATVSFLIDELRPCDRIALVSYGSDVRDEFCGLVGGSADEQQRCKAKVAQLRCGKRTNLAGGLVEGLEILRAAGAAAAAASAAAADATVSSPAGGVASVCGGSEQGSEGRPHTTTTTTTTQTTQQQRSPSVLLLTDGHANHGVVKMDAILALVRSQLAGWAAAASSGSSSAHESESECEIGSSEAVRIFTFGYGADHNAAMLRELSDSSGGLYYYVPSIDAVPIAFGDCLGGLLTVAAQNLKLRVMARNGARIKRVVVPTARKATGAGPPALSTSSAATATAATAATAASRSQTTTIALGDMIEAQRVDVLVVLALEDCDRAASMGGNDGAHSSSAALSLATSLLPVLDVELRYVDAVNARMANGSATASLQRRRRATGVATGGAAATGGSSEEGDTTSSPLGTITLTTGITTSLFKRMPLTPDEAIQFNYGVVDASIARQVCRVVAADAMDCARSIADDTSNPSHLDGARAVLAAASREIERILGAPALASSDQAAVVLRTADVESVAEENATFLSSLVRDLTACGEGLSSFDRWTRGGGRGRILSLSQSHWRQRSNSCTLMMPQGGVSSDELPDAGAQAQASSYRTGAQRRMSRRASFRAVELRADMAAADARSGGGGARRMSRRRNSFSMGSRGVSAGTLSLTGDAMSMLEMIRQAAEEAEKMDHHVRSHSPTP